MIKEDNILKFENLAKFENVIHGFSTNFFGSLRPSDQNYKQSLEKFTSTLDIPISRLVRMDQVHSNTVYFVSENDQGKTIDKTDGILTKDKNIFLAVITGDCVPLLFYDEKTGLIAAVHAGWRGLFSEIIKEAIQQMCAKGSNVEDIIVGIGPSIGVCCYDIPKERADMYRATFPDWEPFIEEREGKIFFDVSGVARYQLQSAGILESNIEDADYCTFDHEDVYSYRREGETFGEMMGIIGMRSEV